MAISRPAGQLPDSGRTLYSIQYLRALAACSVIFPHTSWTGQVGGQQGVDVFFVISGFIMMFVSTRESEPIEFIRSRAIRIIPLYWLATLATALISTPGWRHSLLSALFVPHIDPNGGMYPVVLQGWTLVYEVFFYLIFAVCLCFSRRIQGMTAIPRIPSMGLIRAACSTSKTSLKVRNRARSPPRPCSGIFTIGNFKEPPAGAVYHEKCV